MYTCILNYVYMQDNYVYMYRSLCIHNHIIFFHTSQNLCSAMKNLCSDVPSGPPYVNVCWWSWQTHRSKVNRVKKGRHILIGSLPRGTAVIYGAPAMMTSSNGNIFRVTGPLWGESTGHRWIPLTKASDVELWCFLWSAPKQTVEQTIGKPVIWNAIALIMTSV